MHSIEGDDDATVFRDVILLALLGFVTIVVLLLPHLNPPTKEEQASPAAGNLIVEVRWADQIDADVDLWVEAPGDEAVGYSNKGGHIFNLLRDDLGHKGDITGLNYEMAFSRGAEPQRSLEGDHHRKRQPAPAGAGDYGYALFPR
jgi:hypothetical protein